jgi:hemolysin activation/secretion protein
VFGGSLSYPLLRTRAQSLTIQGQFDALESNIENKLGPRGTTQRGSYDSLRVVRGGLDYAVLDNVLGAGLGAVNGVGVRLSQGLGGLGAATQDDVWSPAPRLGQRVAFTKIGGEFTRTQTLYQGDGDRALALRLGLAWQYSANMLPPAEKSYLGGGRFNRGYYYGQISGDSAVTMSAELQYSIPTPLPAFLPYEARSQFYLFYDWGKAYQNTRLEANAVLQSWGGGVRLFVSDNTEIDLEGVYRLSRFPNGQGPDISPLNTVAFYWQVLFRF